MSVQLVPASAATASPWLMPRDRPPQRIVAFVNQKGGVGKTTLAINFGALAAEHLATLRGWPTSTRRAVAVVSVDRQGSVEWWVARIHRRGRELPFDFYQVHSIEQFRALDLSAYEIVFIDLPGHLYQQALVRDVLELATEALVPITVEPMSFIPTDTVIKHVLVPLRMPYTVIVNKWQSSTTSDLRNTMAYVERKGWSVLPTPVRQYSVHYKAVITGELCTEYAAGAESAKALSDMRIAAAALGFCTNDSKEKVA